MATLWVLWAIILVGDSSEEMEYRIRGDRQHISWMHVATADSLQAQRRPPSETLEISLVRKKTLCKKLDFFPTQSPMSGTP